MMIYILCGVIVIQSVIHHIERKDLYNRIMCKSITEYKGDCKSFKKSAHQSAIERWRNKGGGKT